VNNVIAERQFNLSQLYLQNNMSEKTTTALLKQQEKYMKRE